MKKILIIGGGAAGLSAAATAAEAGADVTVLEKRKVAQGNGRYAEGVFGAGSRLQKRNNIDASPGKIFREAMEFSHWRSDARLTHALIGASGETVDWLMDMGVPFTRLLHHMPNQSPEVFHMAYPAPTGSRVMEVLEKKCGELGVTIVTEAGVSEIIMKDGTACGAKAFADGEERVYEADSVLICTGGFAGNHELMRKLIPDRDPEAYAHLKGILMDGSGVLMAKAVGAEMPLDAAIEGCGPVYRGKSGRGEITPMIRRSDILWVNILGERFCNEEIASDFIYGQNALARQPGKTCWAILDADAVKRAYEAPPGLMAPPDASDNGMGRLYEMIDKAIGEGDILRADSIKELAGKAGINAGTLEAEVADYNTACDAGCDTLFGKDKRDMIPIKNAPFYAVRAGLDIITTHGGIAVNEKMQVVKPDHTPIPGLYAAGIDISGVDSGDYSVTMSGHAFGFALAGGRLAAKEMCS